MFKMIFKKKNPTSDVALKQINYMETLPTHPAFTDVCKLIEQ